MRPPWILALAGLVACHPQVARLLYTIATGLFPEDHGIVGNTMVDPAIGRFTVADTIGNRDPRWWGGEPIWITAERQGHRAATMFWVGSEVPFKGRRATYWHSFDPKIPSAARVDQGVLQ
jgi:predicted AlkP superfamily pyrophosphatase or phosphodiesterase